MLLQNIHPRNTIWNENFHSFWLAVVPQALVSPPQLNLLYYKILRIPAPPPTLMKTTHHETNQSLIPICIWVFRIWFSLELDMRVYDFSSVPWDSQSISNKNVLVGFWKSVVTISANQANISSNVHYKQTQCVCLYCTLDFFTCHVRPDHLLPDILSTSTLIFNVIALPFRLMNKMGGFRLYNSISDLQTVWTIRYWWLVWWWISFSSHQGDLFKMAFLIFVIQSHTKLITANVHYCRTSKTGWNQK